MTALIIRFVTMCALSFSEFAFAVTPMVSVGYYHTVMLNANGTVETLGSNDHRQLGDRASVASRTKPMLVLGLSDVVAIAAGGFHSVALKSDGTVWAWGSNDHGQLGDGTSEGSRSRPMKVLGLSDVVSIAAGGFHSVALKSDGTVWAWGDNFYGQLGEGSTYSAARPIPAAIPNLNRVAAVSAGSYHTLALKADGAVATLGRILVGQLGLGYGGDPIGTPVPDHRYCGSDGMW